jgi:hydrogenase-4 component E
MRSLAEGLLLLVILTDFAVLSMSRLSACIRAVAAQGLLLGALSLVVEGAWSVHGIGLALGTVTVKAVLLPWFLRWAIREASVRREVEPLVGYMASLLLGAAALVVSFAVAARLPATESGPLLVPVALATLIIGLVVLITRTKAVSQVVGYLMLENGIYLFGLTQSRRVPFLVDAGVLLDVFVGVFVMGIVLFHINREFDSISATQLTELKE